MYVWEILNKGTSMNFSNYVCFTQMLLVRNSHFRIFKTAEKTFYAVNILTNYTGLFYVIGYIVRMVYIARTQGAKSGEVFCKLLRNDKHVKTPEDSCEMMTPPKQLLAAFEEKKTLIKQVPRRFVFTFLSIFVL